MTSISEALENNIKIKDKKPWITQAIKNNEIRHLSDDEKKLVLPLTPDDIGMVLSYLFLAANPQDEKDPDYKKAAETYYEFLVSTNIDPKLQEQLAEQINGLCHFFLCIRALRNAQKESLCLDPSSDKIYTEYNRLEAMLV